MTPLEDVQARAKQMVPDILSVSWPNLRGTFAAIRREIVDALVTERETATQRERARCAALTEQSVDMTGGSTGNAFGTARRIAAAIRTPPTEAP